MIIYCKQVLALLHIFPNFYLLACQTLCYKELIIRQCMEVQEKYVLVYKKSGEVLSKLKSRGVRVTCFSTFDSVYHII